MRKLHRLKKTDSFPMCQSCYSVPAAFTFVLDNYIQYLVYKSRIDKVDLNEKINNLFKQFSDFYHKKGYNADELVKILSV